MSTVKPKTVNISEINPPLNVAGAVLFGGDRRACCDEAIISCDANRQIGIATISPTGESGEGPAIVGLWVHPDYRRRGLGLRLLRAAVQRGQERGWNRIHIDVLTETMGRVVRRLPKKLLNVLDVREHLGFGDFWDA